jgi:hypothetical protein
MRRRVRGRTDKADFVEYRSEFDWIAAEIEERLALRGSVIGGIRASEVDAASGEEIALAALAAV